MRTELQIFNPMDRIQNLRINWFEHLERIVGLRHRIPNILFNYKSKGRKYWPSLNKMERLNLLI